ncbi:hypothetical protein ACQEUX_12385 [Micromonospora sp. CA-259024]|uniref:hypothetical protein n=1 Tax=Micromonospora sp. CA-259024 TaxID=3239965 RepID=UPI003D94EBE0
MISNVESLAMIAKVPRSLVNRYGEALRRAYDEVHEGEYGFETSDECREEIRDATEELVADLWNPVRWRFRSRLRRPG